MTPFLFPYVSVENAAQAIDFYKQAFDAQETERHTDPESGRIRHAEIKIGQTRFALHDPNPALADWPCLKGERTSPVSLFLLVDNVDASVEKAVAAGATVMYPTHDQDYGRMCGILDPFGLAWWIWTETVKAS